MKANYHTHTHRCNHALGREEQYVQKALEGGFEIFGFADHSPYLFRDGYYSTFRMRPAQLAGYVDTVLGLRRQYRDRIQIPPGLETEYYPAHFGDLLSFLQDYPLDYLILAQHFVGNEYDAPYCAVASDEKDLLRRYCRQSMEAMNTGRFTYFAHPDLIHFRGDEGFYRDQVRQLCREAKSCGIPLEINLLGLRNGRHYPNPVFWEVAAEEGCLAILGCDAHGPQDVHDPAAERRALALADRVGIRVLETVELRRPW